MALLAGAAGLELQTSCSGDEVPGGRAAAVTAGTPAALSVVCVHSDSAVTLARLWAPGSCSVRGDSSDAGHQGIPFPTQPWADSVCPITHGRPRFPPF